MGYIGDMTHLLSIDPNFLGHPSATPSTTSHPSPNLSFFFYTCDEVVIRASPTRARPHIACRSLQRRCMMKRICLLEKKTHQNRIFEHHIFAKRTWLLPLFPFLMAWMFFFPKTRPTKRDNQVRFYYLFNIVIPKNQ